MDDETDHRIMVVFVTAPANPAQDDAEAQAEAERQRCEIAEKFSTAGRWHRRRPYRRFGR